MTIFLTANNAQSNLAGSITAAATTAALAPGTGSEFPVPGAGQQFSLTFVDAATGLVNEIVYVTAMSGDTITTMLRGQEGTTPRAWLAGDLAANLYTEGQDAAKVQIAGAQNNIYTFGADTGSANAYALATSPTFTPVSGAVVAFTAAHANTGASTFALDGGTAYPIWGGNHSALQGGEIKNGYVELAYNPTLNSGAPVWLLLESTGASLQVAPATQSNQAVQLGQLTGLACAMLNAKMSIATASASATFTADQIVVASALNGLQYLLPSYSETINLGTTGAGGMDTGAAPTSGYVALYAIYNPTAGTANILAVNATSAAAPNIYAGAHMPSGYTASALISVWPTSGSGLLQAAYQIGRNVFTGNALVLTTTTQSATPVSFSVASAIPLNAKSCHGNGTLSSSSTNSNLSCGIFGSSVSIGGSIAAITNTAVNGGINFPYPSIPLVTPQTLYYIASGSPGTMTFTAAVSGYAF